MVSTKISLVDMDQLIWPSATILPRGTEMMTCCECLKSDWVAWPPTRILELKYLQPSNFSCTITWAYQDYVPLPVCQPPSPLVRRRPSWMLELSMAKEGPLGQLWVHGTLPCGPWRQLQIDGCYWTRECRCHPTDPTQFEGRG